MLLVPRKSAIAHGRLFLVRTTSSLRSVTVPSLNSNQRVSRFVEAPSPKSSFFGNPTSLYSYLFSGLKSPRNLFETRRLHAILLVNGFFHSNNTDRVLGSQLVNVYVGFGCFSEALLVFDDLPRKSNLAWNSVLRGFVVTCQYKKAMEFYNLMLSQGVIPDSFTYPLVLKACSSLKDLEQGRKIRNLIMFDETGNAITKLNVYVGCALIDMFAKCGSLDDALQVFDHMPVRDLALWCAMICGSALNGELLEAFNLFKRMRMEGIRPDSVVGASLVPVCARLEDKRVGIAMHGCAIFSGFDCDLFVSNALIDMYCKFGHVKAAHVLFGSMVYKDVVSWNSLIAGYSQNCLSSESFRLFLQMKSSDIRINAHTAASILPELGKLKLSRQGKEMHGYMLTHGFEPDVIVSSALIDMYSNLGALREAKHIFEIFSDRDITLWNSMIAGYFMNRDIDLALGIFRRIWDSHNRPNSVTLLSIIPNCTRMGNLRHGKQIHGHAIRTCLEKLNTIGNALLDMYCKCGYLQLGVRLFDQMIEKNVVTYNTIISAHGVYGFGERALFFFEQMKEEGIRPNKVTFISLLSACSHSGLLDRGLSMYSSMIRDYNILQGMEHYACMVDLLGRAGKLDEAYDFVTKMPVEPNIDILGSLLGACRVHKNMKLAEILGHHVLQRNMNDSGYHVLLSNIFASAGRWNEALKIRSTIKERGMEKEPGRSWLW